MNNEAEVLERINRLCESVVSMDGKVYASPSDDQIEVCKLILDIIKQ
jgi:hypothetical protein